MGDRNFCTLRFLIWFALAGSCVCDSSTRVVTLAASQRNERVWVGDSETGAVFEQSVQLIFNDTLKVTLRRIVVQRHQPTRDGDREIAVLSNLPSAAANAVQTAALYPKRWRIERLFQLLEQCFQGDTNLI